MKIVFVAPFGLGAKTTVWARILPLARSLVRLHHDCTILIPPWDTPEDAGRTAEINGVTLINVSIAGGTLPIMRRLLGEIARIQPDIVHIVKPRAYAGLVQWWLTYRPTRSRIVLDVDDWEQAWAEINNYGFFLARFLAWQEEWGIRHAAAITAASRWLESRCQSYAPGTPCLYLPNGVEIPDTAPPADQTRSRRILYFARFVEVTPTWLATFWRALAAQDPAATLHIAGSALQPGREAAFKHAIDQLDGGLAVRVFWLGFVPPEQLEALYADMAIAIFPTDASALHLAKCSVKLATTLLHGLPVVASAVGEQTHYGANGAAQLVTATATAQEFAAATLKLLDDELSGSAMILDAHHHLQQNYDWSQLGHTLLTFYDSITAG